MCRTFVSVPMKKRLCLYFEHMIGNDPKDFQCWTLKWKGTANNMCIASRIGKDGLKNRVARTVHD